MPKSWPTPSPSPIEQQVNGVENMLYMSSTCSSDGAYSLTVTFEIGTDLDEAQVLVQNRVAIAEPQLPEEVRRQGVTVKKQSTNIICWSSRSPRQTTRSTACSSRTTPRCELRDELSRVHGRRRRHRLRPANYSMRVWLDPEKLKARNLTTQDVAAAIREQNVQVAAGQVGQPPSPRTADNDFQYTVTALGRLERRRAVRRHHRQEPATARESRA